MFYNLHVEQKAIQTDTNIFGTRCLRSLGVEIAGKVIDEESNQPFKDLKEMIEFKNTMSNPPAGNVPIKMKIVGNTLEISGRLFKSGSLAYDPNIGALSLIGATARKLGWSGKILVTKHGLEQRHVQPRNKFVRISSAIEMALEGLEMPISNLEAPYWFYNNSGEKLATIFVHLVVEEFSNGFSIFENHAGSEKGYFITPEKTYLALEKYVPGILPRKSIDIPDLILVDPERREVLNIEGKTNDNAQLGIDTLDNYDDIERLYVSKYYPGYKISRSVVLFGGTKDEIKPMEVSFLLNNQGKMILGIKAPELFKEAFRNLKDFWAQN